MFVHCSAFGRIGGRRDTPTSACLHADTSTLARIESQGACEDVADGGCGGERERQPSSLVVLINWKTQLEANICSCCRYVGTCEGLPAGHWVGIEFDEPVGKNDGCVKGKRFFTCAEGFGSLVRPNNVTVGDFPPEDDFGLSDGDEI